MFADKAGAYQSGAHYGTLKACPSPCPQTLEANRSGKHSSLLRYGSHYIRKKFNSTIPVYLLFKIARFVKKEKYCFQYK
jgi:hypothetical protein